MTLDVCCLVLTLLSANVSDLTQTARFTHSEPTVAIQRDGQRVSITTTQAYREANPLARSLVSGSDPRGELFLAGVALLTALHLEQRNTWHSRAVMLAWAMIHVQAVRKNQERHPEVPIVIVFPLLTGRW